MGNSSGGWTVMSTAQQNALNSGITSAGIIPPGMIMPRAVGATPSGWLRCNGAAVSRTTYANLFAAIGTIWGAGDGSATFNIPNLAGGEFLRAAGGNAAAIGVRQLDSFASHNHAVTNQGGYRGTAVEDPGYGYGSNGSHYGFSMLGTEYVSGNETRPVNYAMFYCIKY